MNGYHGDLFRAAAVLFGLIALAPAAARGASIFVSPTGDDSWSGRPAEANADRSDGPVRTLKRAAELTGPGDTCYLRQGTYHETLRPARSGQAGKPVTFTCRAGETAVLSGADPVTGWKRGEGGVWAATLTWDLAEETQLFADGRMLTEARWPNSTDPLLHPVRARAAAGSAGTITDPKLPGGSDAWKGAMLWCAGGSEWICWSARVTGYDARTHTLTFEPKQTKRWYVPRKGNPYVLMGVRGALDAEGEWWLDRPRHTVHLLPPGGKAPGALRVEAKRRRQAIDLAGLSHVRVVGLRFRAAGLRTDANSADILLDGLRGEYVGHSYEKDITGFSGVLIHGRRIDVVNCEFAYSSGSVVDVRGSDNRVVNCYVHDGNYGAKWRGTLAVTGRRHVIAYNTIRHSGRDLVNIHGLSEALIEYNDLSDAGWLTSDLGMTYGHNTDFAGTVIRRNLVHDNHAPACSMGIYFDHLSHNVIVHHNIVWNVGRDPIRVNNPSYFCLVANNTCWHTGPTTTFDHGHRNDLFGVRYHNNILNDRIRLPAHVAVDHNLIEKAPALAGPAGGNFALKADSKARDAGRVIEGITDNVTDGKPDLGALEYGEKPWRAGHDFSRKPDLAGLRPARQRIAYANLITNACFELPTLEGWKTTGAGKVRLAGGNGWGTVPGSGKAEPTGTSKRELRLGPGRCGVEQVVTGLRPGARHTLSVWLKVSGPGESVSLGVKGFGGKDASVSTDSTDWTRKTLTFEAGPAATRATIYVQKTTPGPGHASCDNLGLPLPPNSHTKRKRGLARGAQRSVPVPAFAEPQPGKGHSPS